MRGLVVIIIMDFDTSKFLWDNGHQSRLHNWCYGMDIIWETGSLVLLIEADLRGYYDIPTEIVCPSSNCLLTPTNANWKSTTPECQIKRKFVIDQIKGNWILRSNKWVA